MREILLAALGWAYLRLVGGSSRVIWINREARERLEATGKGFVYACWHGRQSLFPYLHRGDRLRPLVSKSRDGEIIARVCEWFGIHPIRGSSSRGGASAGLLLQRTLAAGDRVGVTPDGPRGPLRQVQPGVLFAAQKAGVPILPLAFGARRRWVFGGWDEFVVPKPFNDIAVVYGEPFWISASDDLSECRRRLTQALNEVTAEADRRAVESHG